jgi:hypothetical protein
MPGEGKLKTIRYIFVKKSIDPNDFTKEVRKMQFLRKFVSTYPVL